MHTCIEAFVYVWRKLFLGLRLGDSVDNCAHMLKELHQRGRLLGRENVCLILLDVPPNVQMPILMLDNTMRKNVK